MLHFHPLLPSLLALALASAGIWCVRASGRRLALRGRRGQWVTGLALAAVAVAALMLLNPAVTLVRPGGREARLAVLVDGSASMTIPDMPGGESRYQAAVKAAEKVYGATSGWTTRKCYLFAAETIPVRPGEWPQEPPGGATDLDHALATIRQEMGAGTTVVVCSDGNGGVPVAVPEGLELYAVAMGNDGAGFPDLALGEIRAPEKMRAGDGCDFAIPVELRNGAGPREIQLEVQVDGRPAATLRQTVTPGKRAIFSCRTDFREAGIHSVTFTLPRLPAELTYLNNRRTLHLEVRDDRRQTLLCYPVLNSGFRPLLRMLGGQDTNALYKLNNRSVWQGVAAAGQGALLREGFPDAAAKLKEVDLLLLGSTRAGDYTPQERAVLAQYAENGGTIIALGDAAGAFEGAGDPAWEALMPVRAADCRRLEARLQVVAPAADASPLAELARQIPEVTAINAVERMRDGAVTLLEVRGERNYPLLLHMPYGQGRVFALMCNPVANWGGAAEQNAAFRHFWGQLLAEVDEGGNEHLKVELTGRVLRPGAAIGIAATPPDASYTVRATFQPGTAGRLAPVPLTADGGGVHRGRLAAVKAESGTLEVVAEAPDRRAYRRFFRLASPKLLEETTEVRCTTECFLAWVPPRNLHTGDSLAALEDELRRHLRLNAVERVYHPALQTPYLMLALAALLLAQWFLRRRAGKF